jgi:hypothetical protein
MSNNPDNMESAKVEHLLKKFGGRVVKVISVEEYEEEFDTTFPTTGSQLAKVNPWLDYARMILMRDFDREPMDRSTIKTYRIGLKGNDHPDARAAVEKLKSVKPARWTKRDLRAGRLLPRKPRLKKPRN